MKTQVYEMSRTGGLQPIDQTAFTDLQPGAVVEWGGNAAWGPTRYCILHRVQGTSSVMYDLYNLDNPEKNEHLHRVESWNIKSENDASVWHSQHFFLLPETVDAATVEQYRQDYDRQRKAREEREAAAKSESDRLEALGRELWPSLIGECPAVIVAELEQDVSDSQTDYFASQTIGRVILAPSKHKRDLFTEMRKAADLLPETSHLGVGKGRFSPSVEIGQDFRSNGAWYCKGQRSPWHRDLQEDENGNHLVFTTMAEAQAYIAEKGNPEAISFDSEVIPFSWNVREEEIEHREKYSMGKGYYLGTSHYSGWQVSKEVFYNGAPRREDYITLAKRHDHLVKGSSKPEAQKSAQAPAAMSKPSRYAIYDD